MGLLTRVQGGTDWAPAACSPPLLTHSPHFWSPSQMRTSGEKWLLLALCQNHLSTVADAAEARGYKAGGVRDLQTTALKHLCSANKKVTPKWSRFRSGRAHLEPRSVERVLAADLHRNTQYETHHAAETELDFSISIKSCGCTLQHMYDFTIHPAIMK